MKNSRRVIWPDGLQRWYSVYDETALHRLDGPAVIHVNGDKEWWQYGSRHRRNGPAIERTDGRKEWRINDLLHREDGPAYISQDGTKEWRIHGLLHRNDGPAVERPDGSVEWYLRDQKYQDINEWGVACGIFNTEEFVRIKLEYG